MLCQSQNNLTLAKEIDEFHMGEAKSKLENNINSYEARCSKLEEMGPELDKAYERISAMETEELRLRERVREGEEYKR